MSCASYRSAYITRLQARLVIKEAQLALADTSYTALLAQKNSAYWFDSGEGEQRATRVKLSELKKQIDDLESEIDQIYRKLSGCPGISSMNLRRC